MQRVQPEKPLFVEPTKVFAGFHKLVAVGDHKAAEHKKEIDKKIAVINKLIVDNGCGGKCAEVKQNNKAGKDASKNIQYRKSFLHQ